MPYDALKVYGKSDINYVMCCNNILTEEDINTLQTNALSSPTWGVDTIMLAKFNEDTNANSFTMTDEIVGYKIQRYEVDYNKLYNVTTLSNKELFFEDYNLRNNRSYQYRIIPIYSKNGHEVLGSPISTDVVHSDWCGWTIVGTKLTDVENEYVVDYDNIWTFGCNIEGEPIQPVFNKTYVTGFGQYPKVVQGEQNYLEGGLTCLLGNVACGEYVNDSIDALEKWRYFCNNGELKLLKDQKGHVIPCSIKDTTPTQMHNTIDLATTISFHFVQLLDRSDISVYGLGAK